MRVGSYEVVATSTGTPSGTPVDVSAPQTRATGLLIPRDRVRDESAMTTLLGHLGTVSGPGLARVADVARDDEQWLVVFAPCGRRLTAVMPEGALDAGGAVAILDDVAAGLMQLREFGYPETSMSPETVMVDAGGVARIAGGGLSGLLAGASSGTSAGDGHPFALLAKALAPVTRSDAKAALAVGTALALADDGDLAGARRSLSGQARRRDLGGTAAAAAEAPPVTPPAAAPADDFAFEEVATSARPPEADPAPGMTPPVPDPPEAEPPARTLPMAPPEATAGLWDIDDDQVTETSDTPAPEPPRPRRRWIVVVAVVIVLAGVIAGIVYARGHHDGAASATPQYHPILRVAPGTVSDDGGSTAKPARAALTAEHV